MTARRHFVTSSASGGRRQALRASAARISSVTSLRARLCESPSVMTKSRCPQAPPRCSHVCADSPTTSNASTAAAPPPRTSGRPNFVLPARDAREVDLDVPPSTSHPCPRRLTRRHPYCRAARTDLPGWSLSQLSQRCPHDFDVEAVAVPDGRPLHLRIPMQSSVSLPQCDTSYGHRSKTGSRCEERPHFIGMRPGQVAKHPRSARQRSALSTACISALADCGPKRRAKERLALSRERVDAE